jgi:hypothetical protein
MDSVRDSQVSEPLSDVCSGERRNTATIRLLECLRSFSHNLKPLDRGTEEDPHFSFVAALQHNFRERTEKLELELRGTKGFSVTRLLGRLNKDTSASLTTNDLARLVASGDDPADPRENDFRTRRESLSRSEALSLEARTLSLEGRERHLSGRGEEAQHMFEQADDLFREAILVLRLSEEA